MTQIAGLFPEKQEKPAFFLEIAFSGRLLFRSFEQIFARSYIAYPCTTEIFQFKEVFMSTFQMQMET